MNIDDARKKFALCARGRFVKIDSVEIVKRFLRLMVFFMNNGAGPGLMINKITRRFWVLGCCYWLMIFASSPGWAAGFTFNFAPNGTIVPGGNIALGGTGGDHGGNDGTRFIQDSIDIGGKTYFHIVIVDANSAFQQESYTAGTLTNLGQSGVRSYSPFGGGNARSVIGNTATLKTTQSGITSWARSRIGNAKSPFGFKKFADKNDTTGTVATVAESSQISGNGTMDPTRTVFLMQMSDSAVSVEVYKPLLTRKPKVSQTLAEGGLTSQFVADLRSLTYSDLNRSVPVVNTLSLNDPTLPVQGAADFDISFSQKPHVTAGQFTFSGVGQGWVNAITNATVAGWDNNNSKFIPGTYQYAEGGFDVLKVKWAAFFDPVQNPRSQVNLNP